MVIGTRWLWGIGFKKNLKTCYNCCISVYSSILIKFCIKMIFLYRNNDITAAPLLGRSGVCS